MEELLAELGAEDGLDLLVPRAKHGSHIGVQVVPAGGAGPAGRGHEQNVGGGSAVHPTQVAHSHEEFAPHTVAVEEAQLTAAVAVALRVRETKLEAEDVAHR